MTLQRPRVGIERKILTSILWVGILPMALALTVGYIAAREGRSNAVRERLVTSAGKTADFLDHLTRYRLGVAANLAEDSGVSNALSLDDNGSALISIWDDDTRAAFSEKAVRDGNIPPDGPSLVTLYGPDGDWLFSTDLTRLHDPLQAPWIQDLTEPAIVSFTIVPGGRLESLIAAPVLHPESGELQGYVSLHAGANSLLEITLEDDSQREGVELAEHVQIAYFGPQNIAITLGRLPETKIDLNEQYPMWPINEELKRLLTDAPDFDTVRLGNFRGSGDESATPENVLLAYHRLYNIAPENGDLFLIVYASSSEMFQSINLMAAMALVGGMLFIGFLCVNAYRDVHNNIVRPISLLNEGAQIVRQGDFDLKLKVGTGDEIEELSNSFNKMAVALKRNVHQLEESEEKYRGVVNSMRDGIYQTDVHGKITLLNPAAVDILGYKRLEDAVGCDMSSLFDRESISFEPWAIDLNEAGSGARRRLWVHRVDGEKICLEISRNRDYNTAGEVVGVEGIFRDVTTNILLEEEARERSERIAAINQIANVINSSLEAGRLYESLVVELKKLVYCDYAAVAVLSDQGPGFEGRQLWPDHEVEPGYTFSLNDEDSCAAWVARERRLLLVDDLREGDLSFTSQFPSTIRSCLCLPLYATGRIIGTLNLGCDEPSAFDSKDIDNLEGMAPHLAVAIRNAQLLVNLQLSLEEVTRAQEKLHAANEELKTLDELKTNLLSNVSHELRTPLVAVMGYSDMIINGKAGPINNTQREYLEISLRNIEKLVTLIENLLDFSRLHRGDENLVFASFDLVDCAKASMQIVQPVADGRGIELVLDTPNTPVIIEGDKGKMGQVFNNLLSNAVKFNANGGEVKITMKVGETSVDVSVSDTGIGIPPEAQEKVFKRFYQYDASSTRKYGGTGIGLSISQDIVRLHGSSISVESEEGKGATFRFTLALAHLKKADNVLVDDALEPVQQTHVLIELVSLDRSLGLQIRNVLATEGMDMIHAMSGESAIALATKHSPDCIVVDTNLTEKDQPLLESLLENETVSALPIMIITNDDDLYERYRGQVVARIKRDFRKSSLLGGIHHALAGETVTGPPMGDKVLCVDDDIEILSFMENCLEVEGFDVESCKNGAEALDKLLSQEYGLLLLDIAMPGIDGWETCRRIRQNSDLNGVKIYMVTAKPIDQHMAKVQECGADGFLLKPFRPEDLVQLVHGLEIGGAAK